jgi:hypothetical protein
MRFEKQVEKNIEKESEPEDSPEETAPSPKDQLEEIYNEEGLTVMSDDAGTVVTRQADGTLAVIKETHSWYAHFTPFEKMENTPELKSAILINLYDDLRELLDKVDSGEIAPPNYIQGSTNREMAQLSQTFGFQAVNASYEDSVADQWSVNELEAVLGKESISQFFDLLIDLARWQIDDETENEAEVAVRCSQGFISLDAEERETVTQLLTLATKPRNQVGIKLREWFEEKIADWEEEAQEEARESVKSAAQMIADTDRRRVVGTLEDVKKAVTELKDRTLASGEPFLSELRRRAEANPPPPEDDWHL